MHLRAKFILICCLIPAGIFLFNILRQRPVESQPAPETIATSTTVAIDPIFPSSTSSATFVFPITNAKSRVTKKTFGLYVDPQHSPISPERFRGYHTGTDFETFPDEQDADVAINAICTGPLKVKRLASGYGGVAVQQCSLDGNDVTVVYGHLRLSSITTVVGKVMNAGQEFAVLGKGFSAETDGERKHLHLAIHRGASINILGYVQNTSSLSAWLDPMDVLK